MNPGLPRDDRPFTLRSRSSHAQSLLLACCLTLAACAERASDDADEAALADTSPGTDGKFRILTDDNGKPVDLSRSPFFAASFGFRGEVGNYSNCSNTWVSDQGHLLTAFHCIRSCIEGFKFAYTTHPDGTYDLKTTPGPDGRPVPVETGLVKKVVVPNTRISERYSIPITLHEIDESKLADVRCSDRDAKGLEARVLAIGARGFIPEDIRVRFAETYPALFAEYRAKGFVGVNDIGDFALLKVERTSAPLAIDAPAFTYPPRCVKMRVAPPRVGERIWNLSYPAFERSSTSRSHYEPRASGGLVYSKRNHPLFSYESLDMFDDALLFGSTDAEGGSSGSSLVDVQGQVIGVVGAKMGSPNVYQRAATVFIPLSSIWTRLDAVLGDSRVRTELVDGCTVASETEALLDLLRRLPTDD